MSYFSQKKKQKRITISLITGLCVISATLLFSVLFPNTTFTHWVDNFRFQIYILTIVIMIYSLIWHKTIFSIMAICLLLFNYTIISSSTNLFFNVLVKGHNNFTLHYHHGKTGFQELVSVPYGKVSRMGTIHLSKTRDALFVTFRNRSRRFTIVNVDLKKLKQAEIEMVYKNLSKFVLRQDEPLILVGDFGIPAWHPTFKKFLHRSSLEVKNRVLLSHKEYRFSPFAVPTINLLAYKNVGINDISYDYRNKGKNEILQLNFDLEYN